MQTTQYYRVRNKSTKEERGMAVQAYEVGNMKRRWDILGPSDEEGNLIEGAVAVAKPIPQNEGNAPGASPVGDKAPITGSEETRNEVNKRWKNAQAVQAPGGADENPPTLNIAMQEPDIAPQPTVAADEVKFTDQLPPDDAEKEAQARAHITSIDAAVPAEAKPAQTTRRRTPPKTTK